MKRAPFERVVIHPEVESMRFTREVLKRIPSNVKVEVCSAKPLGRQQLFITKEPGSFLKPCPCSPGVVGCDYWVFSPVFQCPFACRYCFLRFYAPQEPMTLYANIEDAEAEFRHAVQEWGNKPVRMGTGEFADSLALDRWTGHVGWLRRMVHDFPQVQLELKTKSDYVESLLQAPPLPNIVVAWSLNPASRVARDEIGAATLEQRLTAARRVAQAGYRVAFHFDPIIVGEGWKEAYAEVVEHLFALIEVDQIAWISLGTLRFPPRFLERWGRSLRGHREFFAEFQAGPDGKMRYFWPLRRQVYRWVLECLRKHGGDRVRVYLCMETRDMWGTALGWEPKEKELESYLTSSPPEGSERADVVGSTDGVLHGK